MGGHGHGHHHEPYKVPDYRIYKVSDAPKLVQLEKVLAAKGLKDPWIRNEVWRFNEKLGTEKSRWITGIFRGFRVGVVAFVITIAGTEIYDKMYPTDHKPGHH